MRGGIRAARVPLLWRGWHKPTYALVLGARRMADEKISDNRKCRIRVVLEGAARPQWRPGQRMCREDAAV